MRIVAENLHFSYRPDKPVLRDASLALTSGKIVVLLGPNGSGKSTLLRLILGQLTPERGQVLLDGRPLREFRHRELATRIAYLPQSPHFETGQRVADVIRAGRTPHLGLFGVESSNDLEIISQAAHSLHLADLLEQPVDELSGGQRQRTFLARALAQEPSVFLLDEPNTYLDLRHQFEIWNLLRQIARERHIAILAASHDLNLSAAFADELILLEQGAVIARGTADTVLDANLLTRVYGIEMERIQRPDGVPLVIPRIELHD